MRVEYHPAVQRDFNEAIGHYEEVSKRLADRIEAEFRAGVEAIKDNLRRFSYYLGNLGQRVFRRYRLPSFPYVMVYREKPGCVRVTVFKSEKQHPGHGMRRR